MGSGIEQKLVSYEGAGVCRHALAPTCGHSTSCKIQIGKATKIAPRKRFNGTSSRSAVGDKHRDLGNPLACPTVPAELPSKLSSAKFLPPLAMENRYISARSYSFKKKLSELICASRKKSARFLALHHFSCVRFYMKRIILLVALTFAVLAGTVTVTAFPATQAMADPGGGCGNLGC